MLALAKMPKVTRRCRPGLYGQQTGKVLDEAEKLAKKAGDSFVPVERILMALAWSNPRPRTRWMRAP